MRWKEFVEKDEKGERKNNNGTRSLVLQHRFNQASDQFFCFFFQEGSVHYYLAIAAIADWKQQHTQ